MNSLFMAATQRSGLWHIHVQVELLTWKSIKDLTSDGGVIKTVLEEGSGWNATLDSEENYLIKKFFTAAGRRVDREPGPHMT